MTPYKATEIKLKLLLAETYAEINDFPAANEILNEVQQEGTAEHQSTVEALQAQINQR